MPNKKLEENLSSVISITLKPDFHRTYYALVQKEDKTILVLSPNSLAELLSSPNPSQLPLTPKNPKKSRRDIMQNITLMQVSESGVMKVPRSLLTRAGINVEDDYICTYSEESYPDKFLIY